MRANKKNVFCFRPRFFTHTKTAFPFEFEKRSRPFETLQIHIYWIRCAFVVDSVPSQAREVATLELDARPRKREGGVDWLELDATRLGSLALVSPHHRNPKNR